MLGGCPGIQELLAIPFGAWHGNSATKRLSAGLTNGIILPVSSLGAFLGIQYFIS